MLITEQTHLEEFCASLKGCDFITVDTEFLREKTYYPKLCLIQIGNPNGEAAAIDPLAHGLDLSPVYDLLSDEKILKVFHAGRQDLEIFFNLTGKVVAPLFDTQIAAMVCGYGDSVGYENLVRNITGNSLDKSVQYTDWSNRPLSEKQIDYALGDVTWLVEVYEKLAAELEKRGRTAWVFQEEEILADPATYANDPYEAWRRVKVKSPKPKTLAVLRELAAWRERRAQEKDLPKSWVMRDETLADMAAQMPKDVKHLKKIRNMSADMAEGRHGKMLLELINDAISSNPKNWPKPQKKKPVPSSVSATADILRMLLKIQAAEHGVATKLLSSTDDLEALAMDDAADIPALKGWRYEIFGREALAVKNGALAVGLKGSNIVKYKVGDQTDLWDKKD
ncbi:MAG: ribonuclease D [Rhodospirillales bacterium]|nr:ribonuclease D [Rhodospirillales bacterium]